MLSIEQKNYIDDTLNKISAIIIKDHGRTKFEA